MKIKTSLVIISLILMSLQFIIAEDSIGPMILRTIKSATVTPADVANLGFGVYQVSAQYNLGSYQQGEWMGFENKNPKDLVTGAVWVEFNWERPETDVMLIDGLGIERKIYLPASTPRTNSTYAEYYWIAEDGSSYYANTNHGHGWPDLTYEQALIPEHLARKSLSPEQKNPKEQESNETVIEGSIIKLKGQLIDQMTNQPISGAKLYSAYAFSPEEVITDSDGKFEFKVSSDFTGAWTFLADCYGWAGNIVLQKEDNKLKLVKEKFDSEQEVQDVSGKEEIDMGGVYAWPSADISIETDRPLSFTVQYKYKNREGYNGPGNSNVVKGHYLSDSLPLGYEVFIEFKDENGKTYNSEIYTTPKEAMCGVVNLKYSNGESKWSILDKVEPTGETGPIEIDVPENFKDENPELVSGLCYGCLKETTCYPLGYRKSGEYCSENKTFILQLEADSNCDNNFECSSNLCIDDKCVSSGVWQKFINWFKNLFG